MTPIGVNSVNMRLWVNMWVNMPSLDLTWSWNVEDAERSRSSSILEIPCKFSCRPNPAPLQRPVLLSELCVVIRSYLIVGLVTQTLFSVLLFHKWPFEPSDFWPSRSRRMKSLGKTRESGGDGSLLCPPGKQSFLVCFNKKKEYNCPWPDLSGICWRWQLGSEPSIWMGPESDFDSLRWNKAFELRTFHRVSGRRCLVVLQKNQ